MKSIIQLKHGQVFLIVCVLPLVATVTASLFVANPMLSMIVSSWITVLSFALFAIWLFGTTLALSAFVPAARRWPGFLLAVINFLPAGVLTWLYLPLTLSFMRSGGTNSGYTTNGQIVVTLLLMVIALMAIVTSTFAFAKALLLQKGRQKATPGAYIIVMISVFLLPVGIWFLQPRINKSGMEDPRKDFDIFTDQEGNITN